MSARDQRLCLCAEAVEGGGAAWPHEAACAVRIGQASVAPAACGVGGLCGLGSQAYVWCAAACKETRQALRAAEDALAEAAAAAQEEVKLRGLLENRTAYLKTLIAQKEKVRH